MLLSIHIEPALSADFSGNSDRADYTPAHFVALARAAGWALRARPGDLCGQELLVFAAT